MADYADPFQRNTGYHTFVNGSMIGKVNFRDLISHQPSKGLFTMNNL